MTHTDRPARRASRGLRTSRTTRHASQLHRFTSAADFETRFNITRYGRDALIRRINSRLLEAGTYDKPWSSETVERDILPSLISDDDFFAQKYESVGDQRWASKAMVWLIWRVWESEKARRTQTPRASANAVHATKAHPATRAKNERADQSVLDIEDDEHPGAAQSLMETDLSHEVRAEEDDWDEEDLKREIRKLELQARLKKLQKARPIA